jgi:hypothetical protein
MSIKIEFDTMEDLKVFAKGLHDERTASLGIPVDKSFATIKPPKDKLHKSKVERMYPYFRWTEDKLEILKKLIDSGKTYSEVAKIMSAMFNRKFTYTSIQSQAMSRGFKSKSIYAEKLATIRARMLPKKIHVSESPVGWKGLSNA